MARPIAYTKKVNRGAKIVSYLKDKSTVEVTLYPGDIVTDLSYVENGEIKKVTGKIKTISHYFKSITNKPNRNGKSHLSVDALVSSIIIDASTEYESRIVDIPVKEILEYGTSETVTKVRVLPIMNVDFSVIMSDKTVSETTFEEDSNLFGVTIMEKGNEIQKDLRIVSFKHIYSNGNKQVDVVGLIVEMDGAYVSIPFESIKSVGKEGIKVESVENLNSILTTAGSSDKVGGVVLPAAIASDPLTVSGSLTVQGVKAAVPANVGERASSKIGDDETVFSGEITCTEGSEIVITGVTLTEDAIVVMGKPETLTFKNCKFTGVTPVDVKTYLLKDGSFSDISTKLIVENCYFGENASTESNKMYNLIELHTKLADGSRIANNYFEKSACNHNIINMYDVDDGATITIENNVFEYSGNAVRIGFINSPKCTVNIRNNTYMETDKSNDGAWAGILIIQPYGTRTVTMADCVINLDGNKGDESEQLWYTYCGPSDTQLDDTTKPKVYVNGVLQK